jgi:hypothetical protein
MDILNSGSGTLIWMIFGFIAVAFWIYAIININLSDKLTLRGKIIFMDIFITLLDSQQHF